MLVRLLTLIGEALIHTTLIRIALIHTTLIRTMPIRMHNVNTHHPPMHAYVFVLWN